MTLPKQRPTASAVLAWISVSLAAATFVMLAVSLVYFAEQSEKRDLARRADLEALAERLEELHGSDPSNSPLADKSKPQPNKSQRGGAQQASQGRAQSPSVPPVQAPAPQPPAERQKPPERPTKPQRDKPDRRPPDEPDKTVEVCLPVVGCVGK